MVDSNGLFCVSLFQPIMLAYCKKPDLPGVLRIKDTMTKAGLTLTKVGQALSTYVLFPHTSSSPLLLTVLSYPLVIRHHRKWWFLC